MKNIRGGVLAPQGFLAAGINAGIKRKRKDLGLLICEEGANVSAVFTTNKSAAASVRLCKKVVLGKSKKYAIIANSGNANACTGAQGEKDAKLMASYTADAIGVSASEVLVASTGPIGVFMPMGKIKKGVDVLSSSFDRKGAKAFAESILTTDLVTKEKAVSINIGNKTVKIGGCAKGSGMICPNMATMLGFITTDADIDKACMNKLLKQAVDKSFNQITVDGDQSTNDSVFFLSSAKAGNKKIKLNTADAKKFAKALEEVCIYLAKAIVRDGEGVTKFIEININGAKNGAEAKKAGYAIANSPLVKTGIFGGNTCWGRVMAALGYSGAKYDSTKTDIAFNGKKIVKNGITTGKKANIKSAKTVVIDVFLKAGKAEQTVWTCDFSYDYVKINI